MPYFEGETWNVIERARLKNHTQVANKCDKIIEVTRTHFCGIMIKNAEGYPTATRNCKLDLTVRPPFGTYLLA